MTTNSALSVYTSIAEKFYVNIEEYYMLSKKFYDIWSGLTTKSRSLDLLNDHRLYGSFLLNYTFGDKETVEEVETYKTRLVKKPFFTHFMSEDKLDGDLSEENKKLLRLAFLFYRLDKTYPHNYKDSFVIPRHKSLSIKEKEEMEDWRSRITVLLTEIQAYLNRTKSMIGLVEGMIGNK